MVFNLGPLARSCTLDLFALELISLLVKIRQEQSAEKEYLSEITICTKNHMPAHELERFDTQRSEKHLYLVTHTKNDAIHIEYALHRLGENLLRLQDILQILNLEFLHSNWIGPRFDLFTADISDMLLTATFIPSNGKCRAIFRGRTSWIES